MPFVRMIVSARKDVSTPARDAVVNTLYFNVSNDPITPTGYQALVDDLWALWGGKPWGQYRYVDVRAYDMADAEPRPQKARKAAFTPGSNVITGVPQVALALSYYADRNLAGKRGRIFLGPWPTADERPNAGAISAAIGLCDGLAGLGGVNVDWSLYSPKANDHWRISNAWVDNAWDIIRSRRLRGTSRSTWSGNG